MPTTSQHPRLFFLLVAAMAVVVVVSNILVEYPVGSILTLAAFTYPIAFVVTDLSNWFLGVKYARRVVLSGFVLGVGLSLWLADPRIALASGTAFLIAHMVDISVFAGFRRRYHADAIKASWWKLPLFSSWSVAALDTWLFFSIAFVGTDVPWPLLATGDFFVKMIAPIALLPIYRLSIGWRLA
ncbi:MAG: VUT family protein [Alphaproteobacteria bacterium]|nr:VUT family protein [Alphaproteobacteria bacterium]